MAQMGWAGSANGDLLRLAAAGGFDALITVDRGFEYQQNVTGLPIPVIIAIAGGCAGTRAWRTRTRKTAGPNRSDRLLRSDVNGVPVKQPVVGTNVSSRALDPCVMTLSGSGWPTRDHR